MDLLPITIFLIVVVVGSCFWITMLDLAFYRSSVVCPFLEKCGLKIEREEFRKLFSMWDVFMMRREMEVLRQMASHDIDADRMAVGLKRRMVIASSWFLLVVLLILLKMIRQAMA
ncbi:hypothetical protein OVA24_07845 [Luteolibacter sp. SL250]|uniref:hypothetical protein n=1 Tax=Luteolibacter sp. SL250 TaxID=2995170 RepID=UPI002270D3C3|nr:hypothetical protein [Luteolibacter sp. SL250]WAC21295.1 hypothetical protein OVA24_07845 [Luteolibacter sp. SL250]